MRRLLFISVPALLLSSCIKPYACECDNKSTLQKSHVLIYASKSNSDEACRKNGQDTTITCILK
jgi:hypothetical protein